MILNNIADQIWCCDSEHRFLGAHIGTRMTIVKLQSGALWLHSPVALSETAREAIQALGEVKYIVCPNLYHHMYAKDVIEMFPTATLYGPKKLHAKRKDLPFNSELNELIDAEWMTELPAIDIKGSLLTETVFFHKHSQTLITSDLVENFKSSEHWYTKWYLKLMGLENRITWGVPLRLLYWNRAKARASMEKIYQLPINNVVIAHGNNIIGDGLKTLKEGLAWLTGRQ